MNGASSGRKPSDTWVRWVAVLAAVGYCVNGVVTRDPMEFAAAGWPAAVFVLLSPSARQQS